MNWRREDTGYAAAAAAAVTFVVYLVAANFGLVPAPIPGLSGAPPASAAIEPVQNVLTPTVPPPVRTPAPQPSAEPAPPPPVSPDDGAPTVAITTPSGTSFGLTEPAVIEGVAKDGYTGIDKVTVSFTAENGTQDVPATVTCRDASRRDCTWSAKVPGVVADYTVEASAVDRSGNNKTSKEVGVTVVNTGGTVEDLGETIGDVPPLLTRVVSGLLRGIL